MWVDPGDDPRETDGEAVDERGILLDYLGRYRLTIQMKCADLNAEQLARRSVPPSTMSLLGLVRHLAEEERHLRRVMAGGARRSFTAPTRTVTATGTAQSPTRQSSRTPGGGGGPRSSSLTSSWPELPTLAPETSASPTSAPTVRTCSFATSWWRRSQSTRGSAATPISCASASTAASASKRPSHLRPRLEQAQKSVIVLAPCGIRAQR